MNFIEQAIENDINTKNISNIQTRFPPEPNGFLHIGHIKAIYLNFNIAKKYNGICNLRFDDTNPIKENQTYIDAIIDDITWFGFSLDNIFYASDYFQQLYDFAIKLIQQGKAYVDEQTSEEIAYQKMTPEKPGIESPFRNRNPLESLHLFQKMNAGEIEEGKMVLRAKIDMASSDMHFRDPIIYRIIKTPHHRTGNNYNVYPMYDFAHGQCDFFEGVSHSLCTLEFEPHRPLYDFFLSQLTTSDKVPHQYEFNKLNLTYTLLSKRNLLFLIENNIVSGWDDPRLPTIQGMKRRGYSPQSLINFIESIGYTKYEAVNDFSQLESAVRNDLNNRAIRISAVLNPVSLIITDFPEDKTESVQVTDNHFTGSSHYITFSKYLFIEKDDFNLLLFNETIRLMNGPLIKLTGYQKDNNDNIMEIYAETVSENIKSKAIHWVSQKHCVKSETRLYDKLWKVKNPKEEIEKLTESGLSKSEAIQSLINENSKIVTNAYVEDFILSKKPYDYLQFIRTGFFNIDKDSTSEHIITNLTVRLK